MIRLFPLASSSKANSTAVEYRDETTRTVVVVDAGLNRNTIIGQLSDLGVLDKDKPSPDALLLTHEHGDHAAYTGQWVKLNVPILATRGTAEALKLNRLPCWQEAVPWHPHRIGALACTCLNVAHDAAHPVAWRLGSKSGAAIVATDWAEVPLAFNAFVQGASCMLLEANYHPDLLNTCNYVPALKRRIDGDLGHMSLPKLCAWLKEHLPLTVDTLYLGHISTVGCHPAIVRHHATIALAARPDVQLRVLEC